VTRIPTEKRRRRLEELSNRGDPKWAKRRGAGYTRKMRKGRRARP
jgi:hypothetical protein